VGRLGGARESNGNAENRQGRGMGESGQCDRRRVATCPIPSSVLGDVSDRIPSYRQTVLNCWLVVLEDDRRKTDIMLLLLLLWW